MPNYTNIQNTGRTRHRVQRLGIWPFTRDVLVLQHEATATEWHNTGPIIDGNRVTIWQDSKPEWLMQGDLIKC